MVTMDSCGYLHCNDSVTAGDTSDSTSLAGMAADDQEIELMEDAFELSDSMMCL